jgi:extracellular matrix regulatory protein A
MAGLRPQLARLQHSTRSAQPVIVNANMPIFEGKYHTPVNIGYGNMVMASKVVAVLSPDSAPMRRLKEEAKERRMLIDATQGRKTRAIIITDSDHVILSAVQVETLLQRFLGKGDQ